MSESSPYIVSARKYRPATFRSVVGQKALTATLKNAVDTRRLAQAYLFCGPRGVGKTSCARIFAKTINCLSPTPDGEACCQCDSCLAIERGNSYNIVELDAASNNSVNDIRNITEQVQVPPQLGNYRVFIIDEVHMLSTAAFNAFLKTLEEPPKYVIFILATTEKHKVIPTILSRCQIYDFKRITIEDMVDHLEYVGRQEGIETDREALGVIARKADGAMRDALSIFDQVSATTGGHITYRATIDNLNVLDYDYYFRLVDSFREGAVPAALLIYKEVRDKGFDSLMFLSGLAEHVRDLMVAADPRTVPLLETAEDVGKKYVDQARTLPVNWYYAALKILSDADVAYRTASGKRLLVELALIRLCQLLNPDEPPFDRIDRTPPLQNPVPASVSPVRPSVKPVSSAVPSVPSSGAPVNPTPSKAPIGSPSSSSREERGAGTSISASQSAASPRRSHLHTVSISAVTEASRASAVSRSEPVSEEGFLSAWMQFMAANPAQHILISAMRKAQPHQTGATEFTVAVDHPALQQAFEGAMPVLMKFLRDTLSNDGLTLQVNLSDTPDTSRRMPPREFLKKIVENNPTMASLLESMEAEMA